MKPNDKVMAMVYPGQYSTWVSGVILEKHPNLNHYRVKLDGNGRVASFHIDELKPYIS